jgi:hypothetical protein
MLDNGPTRFSPETRRPIGLTAASRYADGVLRIKSVTPLARYRLRLALTDGSVVERDLQDLLVGPAFAGIRADPGVFAQARIERGTVVWPDGADLCPDVLIWGAMPPEEGACVQPEADLRPMLPR